MDFTVVVFAENLMCCLLFFLGFPRRKWFAARFLLPVLLCGTALALAGQLFARSNWLMLIYYVLEFGLLVVIFHTAFQTGWEQALYCASAGRASQHLIYQLGRLLLVHPGVEARLPEGPWLDVLAILAYVPLCLAIYFIFARRLNAVRGAGGRFSRRMNAVSLAILFICIFITRFAKGSSVVDDNVIIAESLYAVTCCLLCLIMQCAFCEEAVLAREMEVVRTLWKEDSKRLVERKDIIELINMKCHDIRHKLENYHLPISGDEQRELDSLIRIYDQTYETGSRTLDVLLSDCALLCEKEGIQLTFMGSGECLGFLTEDDLFSLLGNALSNAVEASRSVPEDKRQISMLIRSSGDLVSVSLTNYFGGKLTMEDGLPVTTRPDPGDLHGYGMKSMRTIARKYGGWLRVRAENGVFELTVGLMNGKSRTNNIN